MPPLARARPTLRNTARRSALEKLPPSRIVEQAGSFEVTRARRDDREDLHPWQHRHQFYRTGRIERRRGPTPMAVRRNQIANALYGTTDHGVSVAFNAGNLPAVAVAVRKYPKVRA